MRGEENMHPITDWMPSSPEDYQRALLRALCRLRWRNWTAVDLDRAKYPPDLTRNSFAVLCPASMLKFAQHYACTRRKGHTGRHAAGTGRYIVAVWE